MVLPSAAAEGVVFAAGVGNDPKHDVVVIGPDLGPELNKRLPLRRQRVVHVVALRSVVGVVDEHVDRLVAAQINDPQNLAFAQRVHPAGSRFDPF